MTHRHQADMRHIHSTYSCFCRMLAFNDPKMDSSQIFDLAKLQPLLPLSGSAKLMARSAAARVNKRMIPDQCFPTRTFQ